MKFARSLLIVALLFPPLFSRAAETAADAVFTNGKIYTVNEKQPWAEAMAVRGGEIVYVGDDAGAKEFVGEGAIAQEKFDRFLHAARKIHWAPDNADYWIQWTLKDNTATLWAYHPEAGEAVEILRVSEK